MQVINRKFHNLQQGSPEWLELRGNYFTASEASAAAGMSKYKKRDALLKEKVTGEVPEVSSATQRIFDKGHAAEESCRRIVEERLDEELYPAVITAEIDGLKLHPRLVAIARGHPSETEHIELGGVAPITPPDSVRCYARGKGTMAGDEVLRVQLPKQFNAATQETALVVFTEFHPVNCVGVTTPSLSRMNVFPLCHAVAMPGFAQCLERTVFFFEPLAEFLLSCLAAAFAGMHFVPKVVSQQGGVISVPLDEGGLEFFGRAKNIIIIQTHADAAGRATGAHGGR